MTSLTEETMEISPAARRKAVLAAVLGNAFEWFDFAIYGMFAVVISKLFFPAENDVNSLMAGVAAFGVAYFFRPLGGIVWGLYADKAGRKAALSAIMVSMAVSTGMIGLIPGYAVIGIAAPLLMVLARMLQGFSVGGEFAGATSMLIEFATHGRKGLYGSWQMVSQSLAFGLGSLIALALTTTLTPEALESWGWRVPFLLGILIGPVGYYIRSRADESPEFLALLRRQDRPDRSPLREVFAAYPREMVSGLGLAIVGTVSAYVVIFYVPIYAVKQLGLSMGQAQLSTLLANVVSLLLCPVAGHLSDRVGRKQVLAPAIAIYALLVYPLFAHLIAQPSLGSLMMTQCVLTITMSFFWGPTPATMAEVFPVRVRSTGVSLAYNAAVLLFGGLAPLILTWLIKISGDIMMPAYYVLFSVCIGLPATLLLRSRPNATASHGSLGVDLAKPKPASAAR
jgi:MFS family permease